MLRITTENINAFERHLIESEKSNATRKKYLYDIRHFASFAGENQIDKMLVLQYKAALETQYRISSVNSMLAALNTFLRYAGCAGLCVRQIRIQKSVYCPEEKELTKGEYIRLVRTAAELGNERLALILQTICGTGIRVSELPFVTVESAQCGEAVVICKGKQRRVFLVDALRIKLLDYARCKRIVSGSIFVTRSAMPIDRSNIWREMKVICEKAGVPEEKVYPHNLRHLFARTFYEMEKDIVKLADVLGHSNVNTTRVYTISSGREHKRQVENMQLVL